MRVYSYMAMRTATTIGTLPVTTALVMREGEWLSVATSLYPEPLSSRCQAVGKPWRSLPTGSQERGTHPRINGCRTEDMGEQRGDSPGSITGKGATLLYWVCKAAVSHWAVPVNHTAIPHAVA